MNVTILSKLKVMSGLPDNLKNEMTPEQELNLSKKYMILLVDSDEVLLSRAKEALEQKKYHVLIARSEEEALLHLSNYKVHLVYNDIITTGKPGLELTKYIKRRYPDVLVILSTAQTGFLSPAEAVNAGADSFVVKPIKITDLLNLFDKLITKHFGNDRPFN